MLYIDIYSAVIFISTVAIIMAASYYMTTRNDIIDPKTDHTSITIMTATIAVAVGLAGSIVYSYTMAPGGEILLSSSEFGMNNINSQ
jgi:hypothetical protein